MTYERKYPKGDTAKTCIRDGFNHRGDVKCKGCFDKKIEIDKLREKLKILQDRLRIREKRSKEKPFGENTPSSKGLKANSTDENQKKQGGAKPGHKGVGRKSHESIEGNVDQSLKMDSCPECSVGLKIIDIRKRSIIDVPLIKATKKVLYFYRYECPCCGDRFSQSAKALPKSLFSNRLLAQTAIMHYLHGIPLKRVVKIFGNIFNESALHGAFNRLGQICLPVKNQLIQDFRSSFVKHADETGWRTDGHSGYAWFFGSECTSVFEFRDTRAGSVAREIIGNSDLKGILVVDRYGAYNKMPVKLQYCFAHLLRDVKGLMAEFPDDKEVEKFVRNFSPHLALAMKLQKQPISDKKYYKAATKTKKKIKEIVNAPAFHLGIRRIQDIFQEKESRMYNWAENRSVPAHNNFAERELRPTVVARKVSFGSQSIQGAERRSNIMSVLHSAKKRLTNHDLGDWFEDCLNKIANGSDTLILRVNPQ